MIVLTGDIHGNPFSRFSYGTHPEMKKLTENDTVIVLGDFGIPFGIQSPCYEDMYQRRDLYSARWLDNKPWTTVAIAGNHDDRDAIEQMPEVQMFGGTVRQLAFKGEKFNHIFYIDKPGVYTIQGKKCFIIPGAESHDIQDGILDPEDKDFKEKLRVYRKANKMFRIKHWDWWENEEIDYEAVRELLTSKINVDLVLSHEASRDLLMQVLSCPSDFNLLFGGKRGIEFLTNEVANSPNLTAEKWYCGHRHIDCYNAELGGIVFQDLVQVEG